MKENSTDEIIKEIDIENTLNSVSMEGMEIILNQMKNSVCKIYLDNGNTGTGFFCLIPYVSKLKNIPFLITNEHVLNENDLSSNNKIIISLENNKTIKKINMKEKRIKYTNRDIDVTLVEIKPNIDNLDINNFLELDNDIFKEDEYFNILKNKSIYILHYPGKEKNILVSYGLLSNVDENKIYHKCNTNFGSSGSPILSLDKNKIIGIHFGGVTNKNFNVGTLFKIIVLKLNELKEITFELNNISKLEIKVDLFKNIEKKYKIGKYIGELKNDKREGKGIMYYNSGNRYEGDFRNDKREGKGIYYYNNGDRYEGDFKNDKREGNGIYYYNNGDRYEGGYKNEKRDGKGIYYFNDGSKFEGNFKRDKAEGKGIIYNAIGEKEIGNFSKNKPVLNHANLDIYL